PLVQRGVEVQLRAEAFLTGDPEQLGVNDDVLGDVGAAAVDAVMGRAVNPAPARGLVEIKRVSSGLQQAADLPEAAPVRDEVVRRGVGEDAVERRVLGGNLVAAARERLLD